MYNAAAQNAFHDLPTRNAVSMLTMAGELLLLLINN